MKWKDKIGLLFGMAALVGLLVIPVPGLAADFDEYDTPAGVESLISLPTVEGGGAGPSWFTATHYFPDGTADMIGNFEAEGRLIAITGTHVYLQRTYGSGVWDVVATVANTMDPCFIRVSPDGSRIALGIGYGAPLLVFPTSMLDPDTPPLLHDGTDPAPGVTAYDVNYYDAAWADNQYLVINGGQWPGPPYASGVGVLDTDDPGDLGTGLVGNIGGASAGVAVDNDGNLITGIGYAPGPPNRTGELKLWNTTEWTTTPIAVLDYEVNTRLLADNVLSAAYLGSDRDNNLHVGGGDAFGTGGLTENGYAALINYAVVDRVADPSGPGAPVDEDPAVGEYREFAPDPCENDSATGILASTWGVNIAVMWNPTNTTCNQGSAEEYWMPGVIPSLSIYHPATAPDYDGDGVPDSSDNAYLSANSGQEDTDGDGWGNIADGDFNNTNIVDFQDRSMFRQSYGKSTGDPNYNPDCDMAFNGTVDFQDRAKFRGRMGTSVPYY